MAELVLGPLLRHTGLRDAVIWVETDAPCEVEVLGFRSRTFHVDGHHFGLVVVDGLEPGSATPYEVALDGRRAWPPAENELPPSLLRTISCDVTRIAFASCRGAAPHCSSPSANFPLTLRARPARVSRWFGCSVAAF